MLSENKYTLLSMKTTEQVATGRGKQRAMCRMLICYQNKRECENILRDMPVSASVEIGPVHYYVWPSQSWTVFII